jgi:hypothetical protein
VAVSCHRGNRVLVRWPDLISCRGELARLEPIDGNRQLTLVPLHCGHGRGHVVDDGVQLGQVFIGGLGFGCWGGHGTKVG